MAHNFHKYADAPVIKKIHIYLKVVAGSCPYTIGLSWGHLKIVPLLCAWGFPFSPRVSSVCRWKIRSAGTYCPQEQPWIKGEQWLVQKYSRFFVMERTILTCVLHSLSEIPQWDWALVDYNSLLINLLFIRFFLFPASLPHSPIVFLVVTLQTICNQILVSRVCLGEP